MLAPLSPGPSGANCRPRKATLAVEADAEAHAVRASCYSHALGPCSVLLGSGGNWAHIQRVLEACL